MTTPYIPLPTTQERNVANRAAFEAALHEMDYETFNRVHATIHRIASAFKKHYGLRDDSAVRWATEFVANCIWHRASGR